MMETRRKHLNAGEMKEYKEIVKEMIQKEEQIFGELLQDVMDHLGLSEQEFMMMHQMYMNNPQTQQILMQAQLSPAQQDGPPKITKEKTKEIFLYSEEQKMDSMKQMMTKGGMSHDPMEQMFDMMVEQSKLSDDMYVKYGVDEDEFNAAMLHYNLMNDPEIQRTIMMNMQKLGMGGMGGPGMGGMM